VRRGYSIIERNFRSSYGEIDIVAFDPKEKTLIFVEVKFRSRKSQVSPLESVDWRKIEKLRKTALSYISTKKVSYSSIRFDVIGITEGKEIEVEHIENAF